MILHWEDMWGCCMGDEEVPHNPLQTQQQPFTTSSLPTYNLSQPIISLHPCCINSSFLSPQHNPTLHHLHNKCNSLTSVPHTYEVKLHWWTSSRRLPFPFRTNLYILVRRGPTKEQYPWVEPQDSNTPRFLGVWGPLTC